MATRSMAMLGIFLVCSLFTRLDASAAKPKQAEPAKTEGPSLDATLRFIQEKLPEWSAVRFTDSVSVANSTEPTHNTPWNFQIQNVNGDAAGCRISWHEEITINNGANLASGDVTLHFADVEKLEVQNRDDYANTIQRVGESDQSVSHQATPQVFVLVVTTKPGVMIGAVKTGVMQEQHPISVRESNQADRLAKAFDRAVSLCNKSGEEPF